MKAVDFEQRLRDMVQSAGEFRPYCYHNPDTDTLTAYFKNEPDYSNRLTDHVTLYLSIDSDEIVGCRIKGVSGIIASLPNFVRINHGDIELRIVFLPFLGGAPEDVREKLEKLANIARSQDLRLQAGGEEGPRTCDLPA